MNPRLAAVSAAHVKADAPNVILCGLKTHTRYYYAIRTVHKNGEKGEFLSFSGLTRDRPKGVITRERQ